MWSIALKYILPGVLVCALFAGLIAKVYNNGYDTGAEHVQAQHDKQEHQRQLAIKHVADQVEIKDNENKVIVARAQQIHTEVVETVSAISRDIRKRGLYLAPTKGNDCECVRGEANSPGIGSGGTGRERFSAEDEQFLLDRLEEADKVVAQYNQCREILAPLVRPIS